MSKTSEQITKRIDKEVNAIEQLSGSFSMAVAPYYKVKDDADRKQKKVSKENLKLVESVWNDFATVRANLIKAKVIIEKMKQYES